ncbi:MAG: hypothetical protein AAGI92_06980 [Pseudomonadota bacterium]
MAQSTTTIALTGLLVFSLGAIGQAHADETKLGERGAMRLIQQIDTDRNGAITREELSEFITARYAEADLNNDDSVTMEEAETFGQNRGMRRARGVTPVMSRVDIDGNGTVTLAEIEERADKAFAFFDLDNSGSIEADELPARRGRL